MLLGIVLDFLLGHLTLRFPGCSEPEEASPYLFCLPAVSGSIPIEELLFYAMGPVAIVLVYACADERWLSRYNPKDDLLELKRSSCRRVSRSPPPVPLSWRWSCGA